MMLSSVPLLIGVVFFPLEVLGQVRSSSNGIAHTAIQVLLRSCGAYLQHRRNKNSKLIPHLLHQRMLQQQATGITKLPTEQSIGGQPHIGALSGSGRLETTRVIGRDANQKHVMGWDGDHSEGEGEDEEGRVAGRVSV
ncbi:hypothetical protein KSS87_016043, partial [Heliosperma pusillum]